MIITFFSIINRSIRNTKICIPVCKLTLYRFHLSRVQIQQHLLIQKLNFDQRILIEIDFDIFLRLPQPGLFSVLDHDGKFYCIDFNIKFIQSITEQKINYFFIFNEINTKELIKSQIDENVIKFAFNVPIAYFTLISFLVK